MTLPQLPAEVTLEQVLQTVLMTGGYLREDHGQLREEIKQLLSPQLQALRVLKEQVSALEAQCSDQDSQLIASRGNLGELKQQMKSLEQRLDGTLSEAEFDREIEKIQALLVEHEQSMNSTHITQAGLYRPADGVNSTTLSLVYRI